MVTSYPLRAVLQNPNVTGNIAKWATELAKFELDFVARHAIKSQVLTDFIAEWKPLARQPRAPNDSVPEPQAPVHCAPTGLSSSTAPRGSRGGKGALLLTPDGEQLKYMVHLDFKATNNMVEYEALIFGLSTALSLGVQQLLVNGDSQLIIKQVKGECCCNNPNLASYLIHAQKLVKDFDVLDLHHIPRADNAVADDLSTKASISALVSDGVFKRQLR
jgi:ribonuclease HI